MDPALKKNAISQLLLGLGLQLAGWLVAAFFPFEAIRRGGPLLISAGTLVIIFSCISIAKAKGYAWFVGLLGLLGCVGFGIVWFLLPSRER